MSGERVPGGDGGHPPGDAEATGLVHGGPAPYNCPKCATVTWASARAVVIRCRYCDHVHSVPR